MIVQRPATATAKASVKCHLCNKGKCAIKRVLDEDADIKEEFFDVCDPDARKQVVGRVKDGSFLPSAVKKEIVEAIQWAKIQQKTSNFQADGEFFTEKELDDLVEQGKLEKDDKQALMNRSRSIKCSITGKDLYWKPTYKLTLARFEQETEAKKREIQGTDKIKMAPAQKKPRLTDTTSSGAAEDTTEVPIPSGQLAKLSKAAPKLEENIHKFAITLAEAKGNDFKDSIAPAILQQATEAEEKANSALQNMKKYILDKQATKTAPKRALDATKQANSSLSTIRTKLQQDMKYFKEA